VTGGGSCSRQLRRRLCASVRSHPIGVMNQARHPVIVDMGRPIVEGSEQAIERRKRADVIARFRVKLGGDFPIPDPGFLRMHTLRSSGTIR
jgi:hypothetical protein